MVLPIIAAGIAGVAGMIGSNRAARTQANAANSAANTQLRATRETNDMLRDFRASDERIQRENVARFQPFYQAGTNALGQYTDRLGEGFNFNFQADPGYQFRMNEGLDAVNSSASARHGMNSGAAMKALNRYGQDYASNEYGNVFNREYGMWSDQMNRLSQLAASGQNAAGQQGAAMQPNPQYGFQMAQNNMAGGQAAAQGIANAANARAAGTVGGFNAFGNAIGQGVGMWQQNQLLNAFMPQQQNTGGAPMTSPRPMSNPFLPRA